MLNVSAIEHPLPNSLRHDQAVVISGDAGIMRQQPLTLNLRFTTGLAHDLNIGVDIESTMRKHFGALHAKAKGAFPIGDHPLHRGLITRLDLQHDGIRIQGHHPRLFGGLGFKHAQVFFECEFAGPARPRPASTTGH